MGLLGKSMHVPVTRLTLFVNMECQHAVHQGIFLLKVEGHEGSF